MHTRTSRWTPFSVALLLTLRAGAAETDEKLLLGFEKDEMEQIAETLFKGDSKVKPPFVVPADSKNNPDGKEAYECITGGDKRQFGYGKYLIRKGNATQGEYASARDYKGNPAAYRSLGYWKKVLQQRKPGVYEQYAEYGPEYVKYAEFMLEWNQDYAQMALDQPKSMLYTLRWFERAFPTDWSGYDVFRVDAMSAAAGVKELRVGLEDEYVEPLVYRCYEFPAGKWVTLEFDLREAAEKKHLDPAHMTDIFILMVKFDGDKPQATTVLLDNLRLAKKGKGKTQEKVVPGQFWAFPEPPTMTVKKEAPKGPPPDTSPIKLDKPIEVKLERGAAKQFIVDVNVSGSRGVVSAYDNSRMLLSYDVNDTVCAITTKDGGKTWDKAVGIRAASGDPGQGGAEARGAGVGFFGVVQEFYNSYCEGDFPSPRHWYRGIAFDGENWKLGPFSLVNMDARHCYSRSAVLTLDSGRIWTAVSIPGRKGARELHLKYSDDGGLTWRSWRGPGLSGKVDGADGSTGGSSGGDRWTLLTPYGEHVACVFKKGGGMFAIYDGKTFTKPAPAGQGDPLSVVTLKDKEMYVSTGSGVFMYNGGSWVKENGAQANGLLAAAGKDNLLLFGVWEAGKIACQQKKGGSWGAPKVVADEPGFQRHWRNFGVPQYSPPNFVPIAWTLTQNGVVKVLRVPVE